MAIRLKEGCGVKMYKESRSRLKDVDDYDIDDELAKHMLSPFILRFCVIVLT